MFTRNCPNKDKRTAARILFLAAWFVLLAGPAFAGSGSVIDAADGSGEWKRVTVTGREAVSTNKTLARSEVKAYVAEDGKYQLFAYIHHNWRKAIPRVLVEVVNDNGLLFQGFHRIENIWYLDRDSPGRWFMACLTTEPYWNLPKGELTIRFWAESQEGVWDTAKAAMEGDIAIDKFFLIPAQGAGKELSLSGVIYPESGTGDWDIRGYHPGYATNLAQSAKLGQSLAVRTKVAYPGYYRLFLAVFSEADNQLKIIFQGNAVKEEKQIMIKAKNAWSTLGSERIYLRPGEYRIILKHLSDNNIAVDYLMLLPATAPEK